MERFILNEWKDLGLYKAVLVQLRESLKRNERYGRQKLLEKVNGSGGFYTEAEVRKALSKLSAHGFVRSVREMCIRDRPQRAALYIHGRCKE